MRARSGRFTVPASLVGVAAVWGATFVIVADAIALYPMFGFLAWRFAVATVAFAVFFPRVFRRLDAENWRMGTFAGLFLTAGYIFQTWGLDGEGGTSPARAAFITGLYVVFVPLAQALILRRRPRGATVLGAGLALAGLWLLSGTGGSGGGWVTGDSLVVVAAIAYSAHMLVLGSTDERHDTGALTLVQLVVVTVITAAISLATEKPSLPTDASVIVAIVICGVFASALAFVVQTWAQRRMPPARVALILVLEPAFGGLFGWGAAGVWPIREIAGAALMMGGMVVSEIMAAFRTRPGEHLEFEPAVEGMPVPLVEEGEAGVRGPSAGPPGAAAEASRRASAEPRVSAIDPESPPL